MKRLRLTVKVKRGLERIYDLAFADVECSDPADFPGTQREELTRGFEYLAALLRPRRRQ